MRFKFSLKSIGCLLALILVSNMLNGQPAVLKSAIKDNQQAFHKKKNTFIALNDSLNQLKHPSKAAINSLIASYNDLLALNKNYLKRTFGHDSSALGQRKAFFDFLVYAIDSAHCGLTFKENYYGYSWEKIVASYRKKGIIEEADDRFLFYCDEMLSVLNDGHTWCSYGNSTAIKSLGIDFSKEGESFKVSAFSEGVKSDMLAIGDKLLAIDGVSFGETYRRVKQSTVYNSYPKMDGIYRKRFFRSYYFYECATNKPDSATLLLKKPEGQKYQLRLRWYPARYVRNMYGVRVHRVKKVGMTARVFDNNIGYIKIDKWNPDLIESFDSIFKKMSDTKGLIIDIRNNFGGDYTNFGQTVLSKFLSGDTITMYKQFKNSGLYHRYGFGGLHYQEDENYKKPFYPMTPVHLEKKGEAVYRQPVVLLVNHKHFSSTDLFIVAFRELDIGKIIGRLNAFQLLGQPIHIKTPWNGWQCGLSVMVPYSLNKKLYEEQHMAPDVEVPLSRAEISREEDVILKVAKDYLSSGTP